MEKFSFSFYPLFLSLRKCLKSRLDDMCQKICAPHLSASKFLKRTKGAFQVERCSKSPKLKCTILITLLCIFKLIFTRSYVPTVYTELQPACKELTLNIFKGEFNPSVSDAETATLTVSQTPINNKCKAAANRVRI